MEQSAYRASRLAPPWSTLLPWDTLLIPSALLALLVVTGLLGAGPGALGLATASADEDQDRGKPAEESAPEGKGIAWAASWEDAHERAKKENKLLFAYFGRHNPG